MHSLHGFSLFELLITISIVGILTLIALPSYTNHLTHEHRIEAEIALEQLAASMEQYNTLHDTYQNATLLALNASEYVAKNTYQLSIPTTTDTEFFIRAMPLDDQAKKDSQCGALTLNSQGEKGITGPGHISDCW